MAAATTTLSPIHWLTIRALRDLETTAATHVHNCKGPSSITGLRWRLGGRAGPPPAVEQLRATGVAAATVAIGAIECLAAGCTAGVGCATTHPPVAEATDWVFGLGADLAELLPPPPPAAAATVTKYPPLLEIAFGAEDADVAVAAAAAAAGVAAATTAGKPGRGGGGGGSLGRGVHGGSAVGQGGGAGASTLPPLAASPHPTPCARGQCGKSIPPGVCPPAGCTACGVARYCSLRCGRHDRAAHGRMCKR